MKYYNVEKVIEKGELIRPETRMFQPTAPEGHRLIIVLDNGSWAVAGELVQRDDDYGDLYGDYRKGMWLSMRFYALPDEELEDCAENAGRVDTETLSALLREHPDKDDIGGSIKSLPGSLTDTQ